MTALQWRNTSWVSDQSVCMSILLDLDVERIEAISIYRPDCHRERMRMFLDMLKTLPAYLMFGSGERLPSKIHGWAPASFMPRSGFGMPEGCHRAVQSSLGIVAMYAALQFEPSPVPLRDIAFFQVEDDKSWYRLTNLGYREDNGKKWCEVGPHSISKPASYEGTDCGRVK